MLRGEGANSITMQATLEGQHTNLQFDQIVNRVNRMASMVSMAHSHVTAKKFACHLLNQMNFSCTEDNFSSRLVSCEKV